MDDHGRRGRVVGHPERDHGLGLHAALAVDEQDAEGVEGVGAQDLLEPRQALGGRRQGACEPLPLARHPVLDRHPAGRLVLGEHVVAGRDRHQVRRRRLGQVPGRGAQPVGLGGVDQLAVGDAGERLGHRHRDVVERLVGGVVVDGVPGVGAVRLLHGPGRAVGHRGPAVGGEVAAGGGRGHRQRGALEIERELVALVGLHVGDHDQVLALVAEVGLLAVDQHRADPQLGAQVELQLVVVLGRAQQQHLTTGEHLRVGVPGQVEVVVQRVDAGVADARVDRVLDRLVERDVERRVVHAVVRRLRGRGRHHEGRCLGAGGPLEQRLLGRARAGGEPQQGDEQRHAQQRAPHASSPRSSGRASRRPWWIWALTVPSGMPSRPAISS